MEKKVETINLKTNLKNVPINRYLRGFKCQNCTELINLPKTNKNILNISFVGIKNSIKNNTSYLKTNATNNNNLLQITINDNFKTDNEDELSKSTFIQGNTFSLLLKKKNLNYTLSLKKLYPIFKFNHYSKPNENINKEIYIKNIKKDTLDNNKKYVQSILIDILGLQNNIIDEPENFLIKRDFLERTCLDEIIMIKDDLVLKTLMIDKELIRIVTNNSYRIISYIENNINIGHKIDSYLSSLKGKRNCKMNLKEKFIGNSTKLFLVENKKQNVMKIKYYLNEINKIKDDFSKLDNLDKGESDNKIQELKSLINNIRNKIKEIKEKKIFKDLIIFNIMEKELMNYENKEKKHILIEFNKTINILIDICLVYDIENEITNEKIELKKTNFNLNKDFDKKDKDTFVDLDFECDNFDFMLIYNNIEEDSKNIKIRNTLISLLELFDMIKKQNLDIKIIIIQLKEQFNVIIKNSYNKIESFNFKIFQKLYYVSNLFTIILSNYYYLLFLFQNNFGLAPVHFKDLTTYIRKEMDITLKNPINEYLNEFVITGNLKIFHEKSSIVERKCNSYLNYTNLYWFDFIGDLYQEFFRKYYDKQVDNLKEKLRKENWEQLMNIKQIYQDVFDLITNSDTDTIEDDEEKYTSYIDLDIDNMNKINDDEEILEKQKNNEYLFIKTESEENNSKHKIIYFTLYIIKFIYESLFMYSNLIDENYQKVIVVCTYKTINDIIKMEKDIIINSSDGKINGIKLITEKELSLLNSNILIIKRALQTFLIKYPFNEIKLTFEDAEKSTQYSMILLLNELISEMLNLFNELNFENYPIFSGKGYNEYIFKFTKMKKIYDNMKYAFLKNDIINIFKMEFNNVIDSMEKIVGKKPNIVNDAQLKQFRREMVYMRKVLEMFDLIDVKEYQEKIEKISKIVNPNKVIKRKKKIDKDKDKKVEEDEK